MNPNYPQNPAWPGMYPQMSPMNYPGYPQQQASLQQSQFPNKAQQYQQPLYQAPQPQQTPPINGRIVNSIDEVAPNEIAMDGTVSFFPTRDYACVYAKAWNRNGNIDTFKYVLERTGPEVDDKSSEPDPYTLILQRLDSIEEKLLGTKPSGSNKVKPSASTNTSMKDGGSNA